MNSISLTILLHYYSSVDEYKSNTGELEYSQSEKAGFNWLVSNKLLDSNEFIIEHKISERGKVHIRALLDAPLPVQQWVSPINKE